MIVENNVKTNKEDKKGNSLVNIVKSSSNFVYRFFAEAPDANLCSGIATACFYFDTLPQVGVVSLVWGVKQYLFGMMGYAIARGHIIEREKRDEEISIDVLKEWASIDGKEFYYFRKRGCFYFGAAYAVKEYERELKAQKNKESNDAKN